MTERLYYTDPYCREFEATVEHVEERDGRTTVRLDRTAFYPTSGGQPFDTGRLGPHRVTEVTEDDDGTILHVLEEHGADPVDGSGAVAEQRTHGSASPGRLASLVGGRVHGIIDWTRRFDHMQQHTGQHVLSAACERLFAAPTVAFHLGGDASTIDLARELSTADLAAAEAEANRIVWDNRPVAIRFVSADEARRLPLRKQSLRGGTLRLVEVEGVDLSACGGTHVARTGAIGIVAIGSSARFKGGQRVEFFCGGRALSRFRSLRETNASAVRLLSVLSDEVPAAIERLQAESKEHRRSIAALHLELADYRANELADAAEPMSVGRLVLRAIDDDAAGLKSMAAAVATRSGHVAVLVSTARPALVVVARSPDVSLAANEIVRTLTTKFGGRGGGKPDLAQAGGLEADAAAILSAARGAIVGSTITSKGKG